MLFTSYFQLTFYFYIYSYFTFCLVLVNYNAPVMNHLYICFHSEIFTFMHLADMSHNGHIKGCHVDFGHAKLS